MANHPSAEKRARQSEARRLRNRIRKRTMRSAVKRVEAAIKAGNNEQVMVELGRAISIIDRAGQRGAIHKRQASRRVSRIVRRVKAMSAE